MNSNLILKSDVLDIVFENRNKAYGAYDLRKFYPSRIKIALGIMLIIAFAFSAFTLLPDKKDVVTAYTYEIPKTELTKADNPIEEPAKKPELKKPEALPQTKPVDEQQYTSTVEIVDKNVITAKIETLVPDKLIGSETIETPDAGPAIVKPAPEIVTGSTGGNVPAKPDITKPMESDAVDILPSYPGGMDALIRFLKKNLVTPDVIQDGETVNVRIRFVVGYNGKLQSFVTVLDGGEVYNKEVIRVLKKMPDWIPGKARGENVPVYYTIPVKFIMAD